MRLKKRKNVIIKNARGVKRNPSKKNKKSPECNGASKVDRKLQSKQCSH